MAGMYCRSEVLVEELGDVNEVNDMSNPNFGAVGIESTEETFTRIV